MSAEIYVGAYIYRSAALARRSHASTRREPTLMKQRPDYSRNVGGGALGARLRRLSERIDRDVATIYAEHGVDFEQRWFGVLNQIVLNGPMFVGEIASTLGITHVSVSQASRSLEAAGLIHSLTDPVDARRRRLGLTEKGELLIADLSPLWQALSDAAIELNEEAGNLVGLLDRLDDALDRRSLPERVRQWRKIR